VLEIEYDLEKRQFISQSTRVFIKTDIPIGFNAGYEITPSTLESRCVDAAGNVVEEDFAQYSLDGQVLQVEKPIIFDSFSNTDSLFLNDTRAFAINFLPTPELDTAKSKCEGSANIYIALRL
jgi:hypothetical protein